MLNVLLISWNLVHAESSPYSFACTKENLSGTDKAHLRVYRNEVLLDTVEHLNQQISSNIQSKQLVHKSRAYTDERLTDGDKACINIQS